MKKYEVTPERAAELDAKYAENYRNRKPHVRYIVVWRPKGSLCWSQSQVEIPGTMGSVAMLYCKKSTATARAREIRKQTTPIARPVRHLVHCEARVISVNLPR